MKCPNCEALIINKTFCHKTDCPTKYLYVPKECKECGGIFQNNGEKYIGDYCNDECKSAYLGIT